ncbi:cytochrome P450 3A24-like [Glandiceps talaboti]
MEILWFSLTWWLVALCILLFYIYSVYPYSTFNKLGLSGPKPWPLLGSFVSLMTVGFQESLMRWEKEYGKVFGMYLARQPLMVISDVDMVKEILVKQFSHFPNRKKVKVQIKPFTSSLTIIEGLHWKYTRNILTPAFSGSKMKKMFNVVKGCADTLVSNLMKDVEEGKDTEFKRVYGCYSIDCIGSAAFGIKVDSQNSPDNPFVKHSRAVFDIKLLNPSILLIIMFPSLAAKLNLSFLPKDATQFFEDVIKETVKIRQSDTAGEKPVDFLQLMLNAHKEESHPDEPGDESLQEKDIGYFKDCGLDTDEILANALIFFLAGYETVSSCLGYTSNLIATHQDVQDKLVAEINTVMEKHDDLDYAAIHEMTYLDMVLQESLRLYSPAVKIERRCMESCQVKGYTIPKDMNILIPIWTIHRNPQLWPEPEKFNPERFSKEEKEKRSPYAWLPFGAGPRNCIGMRFALMEAKVALVKILQTFKFEPCAKTEIPPQPSKYGKMTPPNGFWLKMTKRK